MTGTPSPTATGTAGYLRTRSGQIGPVIEIGPRLWAEILTMLGGARQQEAKLASTPPRRALSPATLDFDEAAFEQRYSGPPYAEGPLRGAITYTGFAQFDQKRHTEHRERDLPSLFALDPALLAPIFAALASPHRLTVLRALCAGPRSRQELQELLGVNSAGHLYHHLKELLATGLVVQQGRSAYAIPRTQLITVCVALMAAADLLAGSPQGLQTDDRDDEEEAASER